MTPAVTAVGITALVIAATIAFALIGSHRLRVSPSEYMIGGRSFGSIFLWLLMAGEIYTSFTFLGAAGWAYGKGAPAFYILAYGTIGYVIGYFLLPAIWRRGQAAGLLTAPDFLFDRYGAKWLSASVSVIYFFLIIPYITLQLTGMQILLTIAGYGTFDARVAVVIAFLIVALFVFAAGLRGTAWASIIKDSLVLLGVIFAGVVLPIHFFGSPAAVFDRIVAANPNWLTLQPGGLYPPLWYVTTVAVTGIGFFMGAHNIAATFSAKSEDALRRNAIFLPLYQLLLVLVFFAGFTALLLVPGLKGPAADQSFMLVVQKFYPPWVLGLIAGAGCLAGLVPASAQLLGAASVLSKNFLGDVLGIATEDRARTTLTRVLVLVIALLALWFWTVGGKTLVELLLFYYNGIIQMLPAFVFGLLWPRVNAAAIGAGIGIGLAAAVAIAYMFPHAPSVAGVNPGVFSLALNVLVCTAVTLLAPRRAAQTP